MIAAKAIRKGNSAAAQSGFSFIEMMIALAILLAVSGIVLTFMFQMTSSQASISNRAEMHSGVRSVTEVLQQEISQAGRITLSPSETSRTQAPILAAACGVPPGCPVPVDSSGGMFQNMLLVVGPGGVCAGCEEEVVTVTDDPQATNVFTAVFTKNHGSPATVRAAGGFITGILSTANGGVLKMFGDINDDPNPANGGGMVYVEYVCNPNDAGTGTLTRQQVPWNYPAGTADADFPPQVLLSNLRTNPVDQVTLQPVPCFSFQTKDASWTALDGVTVIKDVTCSLPSATQDCKTVVNVAVTLTARTEFMQRQVDDPANPLDTRYDYETKALLTVSPRNVFQAWEMSTMFSAGQHVQSTPATITSLYDLHP